MNLTDVGSCICTGHARPFLANLQPAAAAPKDRSTAWIVTPKSLGVCMAQCLPILANDASSHSCLC